MAIAMLEMRDHAGAEEACRRAIAIRPDAVSAYHTLGLTLRIPKGFPTVAVSSLRYKDLFQDMLGKVFDGHPERERKAPFGRAGRSRWNRRDDDRGPGTWAS